MTNNSIRNKADIRFSANELEMLILLIPFFRPDFISLMYEDSILNKVFTAWRVLSFIYVGLCLIKQQKMPTRKYLLLVALYSVVLCASSYLNRVGLSGRVISMMNFIGILLIYQYYSERNPRSFIAVNFWLFSILTIVNALLLLLFPMGLNNATYDAARINFLGKDNTLYLHALLTVTFCLLYRNLNPTSNKPLFIFWVAVGTQLYLFSATGIVVFVILLAYSILVPVTDHRSAVIKPVTLLAIFSFLQITIVFLRETSFVSLFLDVLGKDVTFSDRIYYWKTALYQWQASPLLGQGSGTVVLWNNGYYAHNAVLDVMLKGGVVGLITWLATICIPMLSLRDRKKHRVAEMLTVIMFCFLVSGLMEGLEDRIAFNAFTSLLSVYPALETEENLLNNIGLIRGKAKASGK